MSQPFPRFWHNLLSNAILGDKSVKIERARNSNISYIMAHSILKPFKSNKYHNMYYKVIFLKQLLSETRVKYNSKARVKQEK